MKTFRTKQDFVERNRSIHIRIGMIIAMALVLTAFEWKTYEKSLIFRQGLGPVEIDTDFIPVTVQRQPPPPPPATTEFRVTTNPDIDLPDITIDVSVLPDLPEIPYFPVQIIEEPRIEDEAPIPIVEIMPVFPGGEKAMQRFLNENLRYPPAARAAGISGTVFLTFVVERDGRITEIAVLRGVEGGCTEEAIRVINLMPPWNPGIQSGRTVRVRFNMPIKFILQ